MLLQAHPPHPRERGRKKGEGEGERGRKKGEGEEERGRKKGEGEEEGREEEGKRKGGGDTTTYIILGHPYLGIEPLLVFVPKWRVTHQ